ncbi:slr1659 superfamily regulator [Nostoc sp. CALU 546]|uniref:slr1659 superfamily regulator n=1 Tax=Nostoc sp. CALU 546 TaxID=1867241 RepID=UPI003B66EA6C
MEIKTENYNIWYNTEVKTVTCQGSLRLSGMEESLPIVQLLDDVLVQQPSTLTLNLRELNFLNSSGINMVSKFVIKVRQQNNVQLVVQGSNNISWQGKSLKNLQRLMPNLQLEWE